MKKLFLLAALSALTAGCSRMDMAQMMDGYADGYYGPLRNYDGRKVEEFHFEDDELAGSWNEAGVVHDFTWPDGEPLPAYIDMNPVVLPVKFHYLFNENGTGTCRATARPGAEATGDIASWSYDFRWKLRGNRLAITRIVSPAPEREYGLDGEMIITQLSSGKLVVYRRTPFRFSKPGDSYFHVWDIFERSV